MPRLKQAATEADAKPRPKPAPGWTPPPARTKTFAISTGKATVKVSYGPDTVDAKLKIVTVTRRHAGQDFVSCRTARDAKGRVMTAKVPVKATMIKLKLPGTGWYTARSCCKPPDVFTTRDGYRLAAERLVKVNHDFYNVLGQADRRLLHIALFPWKFKAKERDAAWPNLAAKRAKAGARKKADPVATTEPAATS